MPVRYGAGHVRVYTLVGGNEWSQLGSDIDGEGALCVSLSANGSTVAIGAPRAGYDAGHVRVYTLVGGNEWSQLGSDIDGEGPGDQSGWSVSLSADGGTVAIGAPNNAGATDLRWARTRV
jgi:hypothetical protein